MQCRMVLVKNADILRLSLNALWCNALIILISGGVMKRKVLALLLSASMLLSVAGCSKNDSDDRRDRDRDDDEQEETVLETEAEETEAEETRETRPAETTVEETEAEEVSIERDGDYIVFGHYEQDGDLSNGPEPIEWEIVSEEDGRLLLISRYALDCQPYNNENAASTWETCSLRAWLNDDFVNTAFSSAEQEYIIPATLTNPDNEIWGIEGGNDTEDMVFCLSYEEVMQYYDYTDTTEEYVGWDGVENITYYYFPALMAEQTPYALSQPNNYAGIYIDQYAYAQLAQDHNYPDENLEAVYVTWWLRSPIDDLSTCVVNYQGDVNMATGPLSTNCVGVRPAIYIPTQE